MFDTIAAPGTPPDALEANLSAYDMQSASATILIVDSEDINRRVLRGILKTAPYNILECSRASDATGLIESEPLDLIIVDLMLPEVRGPAFFLGLNANPRPRLV